MCPFFACLQAKEMFAKNAEIYYNCFIANFDGPCRFIRNHFLHTIRSAHTQENPI